MFKKITPLRSGAEPQYPAGSQYHTFSKGDFNLSSIQNDDSKEQTKLMSHTSSTPNLMAKGSWKMSTNQRSKGDMHITKISHITG